MKTLQCREHGGTFTVIPRRGRPPVKCTPDNVCSRYGKPQTFKEEADRKPRRNSAVKELAKTTRGTTAKGEATLRQQYMDELREPASESPNKAPEAPANGRSPVSASLIKAKAAKSQLEAQGWVVHGSAKGDNAMVTAARGEETIFLGFKDGELVEQNYLLWNVDRPSANMNGMPAKRLTFDTDEMTDSELIRALSGMRVVWWNRLASNTETAIIGSNKIVIEHSYAGDGDETPADRIVKFTDHTRQGDGISGRMRAFRVGALLKVG